MNDRKLTISVGGSRKSTSWMSTEITWPALCERLRTPIRGRESHEAYMRMPKAQQDQLKDIGGFVGGTLRGGAGPSGTRRKAANVTGRDLVTLDLDAIRKDGAEAVRAAVSALGCASVIYSTRKHDPSRPRLRVIIPLDRTVTAEEYEPIARRVAEWLGIEQADPTTFESWRLMYWPSCSADSDFIFDINEGDFLSPESVLKTYRDWHDMRDWPQVPGQQSKQRDLAAKQEDPESKKGIIGAFCKTYTVRRVMDELIPGEAVQDYTPNQESPVDISCVKVMLTGIFLLVLGMFGYVMDAGFFMEFSGLCLIAGVIVFVVGLFIPMHKKNAIIDEELPQRQCPRCGKKHDFDYPKCPHCDFDYLAK